MNHLSHTKPAKYRSFLTRLTRWHKTNRRHYPWRGQNSLYELLLAEILLQRTNAAKVESVFAEMISTYPKPADLAHANPEKLRHLIAPLGLPTRVKSLISLGKSLETHSGPWKRKDLMGLKGVGAYISGAVHIHHYGRRTELLDPNIIRIYGRIFGLISTHTRPRNDPAFLELSKTLLPSRNISDYIYALLDFGALVCKAINPICQTCPMFKKVCPGIKL